MSQPLRRHEEAAERIIMCAGLTFALAAGGGKEGDLREARAILKAAICQALLKEFEHASASALSGALD